MLFPLLIHSFDLVVSSVGVMSVKVKEGGDVKIDDNLEAQKRGLMADDGGTSATAADIEDPLAVLKRGYRVALALSAVAGSQPAATASLQDRVTVLENNHVRARQEYIERDTWLDQTFADQNKLLAARVATLEKQVRDLKQTLTALVQQTPQAALPMVPVGVDHVPGPAGEESGAQGVAFQ